MNPSQPPAQPVTPPPPAPTPPTPTAGSFQQPHNKTIPVWLYIVGTFLVIIAVGISTYYYQQGKITQLNKQIKSLQQELKDANAAQSDSGVTFTTLQGVSSKSRDTERTTDIKALHSHAEVYFAQNGMYPTLANMNDASWRAVNMKGLDDEALRDPQGNSKVLVGTPAKNVYAYTATNAQGAACNNTSQPCMLYTLTATLESGEKITQQNLN
jgi:hypothetical protein